MRIGIFGGTFNPPHLGHRHIVEDFRAQMAAVGLPLDKVLIIPTFVPPHKETPDLASGEDRQAMCRKNFSESCYEVSDMEIARGDTSYTWMTLEDLHEMYEDAEFYFLMGDDMLQYLPKWRRPEYVLEQAVLVSTIRSRECTVDELRTFAEETYPEQYADGRFLFFESEPFPVSSTEVRELVKKAKSRPIAKERLRTLLDPAVLDYILERELYQ